MSAETTPLAVPKNDYDHQKLIYASGRRRMTSINQVEENGSDEYLHRKFVKPFSEPRESGQIVICEIGAGWLK